MSSIEPSADQFQTFMADMDDQSPIAMINLLRYRERASYTAESTAEPCSGREAYRRYAALDDSRLIPTVGSASGF